MNEPVDAATPMQITLTAQEWNSLLNLLHDVAAPYRVTAPLINQIASQAQQQAAYAAAPPMQTAVPNGDARMPSPPAYGG